LTRAPYLVFSHVSGDEVRSPVSLGGDSRPCLTAPTPSEMRFRLKIPPRAVLTFAIGIKPWGTAQASQVRPTGKVRFIVRAGEEAPMTEVFRREIHLARSNQWIEQSVNLNRFAGGETWLSFESTFAWAPAGGAAGMEAASQSPPAVGLFAEPVLHDRARYREGRAVVLISIDTLRRDHTSLYGYRRRTTPGLENLARQAVVFDDAVSTSSWTLPAHASLLTSLYPSVHGAVNLNLRLSDELPGLPRLLKEQGFFSQAIVTHLYLARPYGFGEGFDRHFYLPETRAKEVTDRAIGFLRAKGDRDFFLFLHYYDPHWHYDPRPPYDRIFDPLYSGSTTGVWWEFKHLAPESIDPRDLQHIVALYDGEIRFTDRQLERLFGEMKGLEVFDKALLVVTADHGEEFLDHGGWEHQKTLYEEQIRVPLLIKLPGSVEAGRRVKEQVSLIDVAPTVLDILGLSSPPSFQGRSLMPLLGGGDSFPRAAWSETEHTVDGSHKLALRRGAAGRKLIFSLRGDGEPPVIELYDLRQDAVEKRDLASGAPKEVERAQTRLEHYLALAAERRAETPPSFPVDLSPEQLDKLRALGYVR
ncbi:MAG: sulfatase, partial [Acidobacteriota bacterium]